MINSLFTGLKWKNWYIHDGITSFFLPYRPIFPLFIDQIFHFKRFFSSQLLHFDTKSVIHIHIFHFKQPIFPLYLFETLVC